MKEGSPIASSKIARVETCKSRDGDAASGRRMAKDVTQRKRQTNVNTGVIHGGT